MRLQRVPAEVIAQGHHRTVAYTGRPFAPAEGTYAGIDGALLRFETREDSGATIDRRSGLARVLQPLMAAALFEAGFVAEAGPLTTWSN